MYEMQESRKKCGIDALWTHGTLLDMHSTHPL